MEARQPIMAGVTGAMTRPTRGSRVAGDGMRVNSPLPSMKLRGLWAWIQCEEVVAVEVHGRFAVGAGEDVVRIAMKLSKLRPLPDLSFQLVMTVPVGHGVPVGVDVAGIQPDFQFAGDAVEGNAEPVMTPLTSMLPAPPKARLENVLMLPLMVGCPPTNDRGRRGQMGPVYVLLPPRLTITPGWPEARCPSVMASPVMAMPLLKASVPPEMTRCRAAVAPGRCGGRRPGCRR